MARTIDPSRTASSYRDEIRKEARDLRIKVVGVLSDVQGPSATYARYTELGCEDVGFEFQRVFVRPENVCDVVDALNADSSVHGILIYYPILGSEADANLKERVSPCKDLEGLSKYWLEKLYDDIRFDDTYETRKAILPCTPLAILKLLLAAREETTGTPPPERLPFSGSTVVVFNRSEVVGRPLASMLSHDGARVLSFDERGCQEVSGGEWRVSSLTRAEALAAAEIVVTGVPSRDFPLVSASEIAAGALCLNFSTFRNFADDIGSKASAFVPRVGPMTVTMALRNVLRLCRNYG